MRNKNLWISLSLVNLCIVALLGLSLRTKFLFPIPFYDYRNFLSAHSHFAFGGWVTLSLMILYIETLLNPQQKQKKIYQWLLWGIEITSLGMAVSFPFRGYAFFSILFSTSFIFITYAFAWTFIRDLRRAAVEKPVRWLSVSALVCLVVSSVGPFTLAYIMATKTGNAFIYRDAIYTYLHFQYNGFFTMSVLALLFARTLPAIQKGARRFIHWFAIVMPLSIIPALFLSLLWHSYNVTIQNLALAGCAFNLLSLVLFFLFAFRLNLPGLVNGGLPRLMVALSLISFVIKMLLQVGTIIPELRNAVFGYRPIIIGFLHLVFLGLVTFYILSHYWMDGVFEPLYRFAGIALLFFAVAIIFNEAILLVDGVGLMLYSTNPIYPWLLWYAAILLCLGACLILVARLRCVADRNKKKATASAMA